MTDTKKYSAYDAEGHKITVTIPGSRPESFEKKMRDSKIDGLKMYRSYDPEGNPIWVTIPRR